jgi:predicted component of type VI protein secretion system
MATMQSAKLQLGTSTVSLDERNPRVLIGRDASCGLVTPEISVSRRHAEVSVQGDQLLVRDLGSSNGTWINGKPVAADPSPIKPGDQVFLGHIPLAVEWEGGMQGKTVVGELPADLRAMIEAHKNRALTSGPAAAPMNLLHDPPMPGGPAATMLGIGGRAAPPPAGVA